MRPVLPLLRLEAGGREGATVFWRPATDFYTYEARVSWVCNDVRGSAIDMSEVILVVSKQKNS